MLHSKSNISDWVCTWFCIGFDFYSTFFNTKSSWLLLALLCSLFSLLIYRVDVFNVVLFADVRAIVEYIYSDEYCVFFGVFMLYLFCL